MDGLRPSIPWQHSVARTTGDLTSDLPALSAACHSGFLTPIFVMSGVLRCSMMVFIPLTRITGNEGLYPASLLAIQQKPLPTVARA
jgi:hypothetical protein